MTRRFDLRYQATGAQLPACARCGRAYRPFIGKGGERSRYHAACHFSAELQDDLLALTDRFPFASFARMAKDLRCTEGVVVASINAALVRAGRPPYAAFGRHR
jgi:hypothetical protein